MTVQRTHVLCALVAVTFFFAGTSRASIVTPIGVTSSTAASDLWPAVNLINDSGLSGTAPHGLGDTHDFVDFGGSNSWVTDDPGGFPADYFLFGPAPVLTFDLGGTYELNQIHIWNYVLDGNDNQAMSLGTVEFSTTGVGGPFSGPVAISPILPVTAPAPSQTFSLGGTVTANAVRVTVSDNYFGVGNIGGDRVGLSEVKFNAIPEPAALIVWSLLGTLAIVGWWRRRKPA
jgi:hypothetical protein